MKIKFILSFATLCLFHSVHSQWATIFVGTNNTFVRTDPVGSVSGAIRSIGFGNFVGFPFNATQSRLHVIDFGVGYPANGSIPAGSLFRLDGFETNTNYFSFCTGADATSSLERFRLSIPASTDDVILQTTRNGRMFLRTNILDRLTAAHLPFGFVMDDFGFTNPVPGNNLSRIMISRDGSTPITRPLSLLHLGYDFPALPQGGQRNWMDVGMICMAGTDHVYIGLRQQANSATGYPATLISAPDDRQDGVLCWGDNVPGSLGPDNMCFVYTAPPSFSSGRASSNDGLEIMRMIYNGNVGLGPVFSNNNQPKSNFHMHNENWQSNWLQITNEQLPGASQSNLPATGGNIAAADGLRLGIIGSPNALANGVGILYNQEDRPLLFSSNGSTAIANAINTRERMRIMSYGTPTALTGAGYGSFDPAPGTPSYLTRISMSHDLNLPLTRPLSLLHIGYNTGIVSGGILDGWRPWMDIGTFTSNGADHTYFGLKQEGSNLRQDAIIGWGMGMEIPSGPDNLCFVFTTATGTGTAPANSLNGLEGGRMTPTTTSGVFTGFGGSPTTNPYTSGGTNATNTVEINAWGAIPGTSGLRFTDLKSTAPTVVNPGSGVLAVDANGDVIYVDPNTTPPAITADNGATINPAGNVQWGQVSTGTGTLAGGELIHNTEIPFNDFHVHFTDPASPVIGQNRIQLGNVTGGLPFHQASKISAIMGENLTSTLFRLGGYFSTTNNLATGAIPLQMLPHYFGSISTDYKFGSIHVASSDDMTGSRFIGSSAVAYSPYSFWNIGSSGKAYGNTTDNTGVYGTAGSPSCNSSNYGVKGSVNSAGMNFGVYGQAANGTANFGVYGTVPTSPTGSCGGATNFAGYFDGNVYIAGSYGPSDLTLKDNINVLENALAIINRLRPKTFEYKHTSYPSMNLPQGLQYGFIAQEIETILPHLVTETIHPAVVDSTGNVLISEVHFKGLGSQQLIPILAKGIQEQQAEINNLNKENSTQDSIIGAQTGKINELSERLAQIEECLAKLSLCNQQNNLPSGNNNDIHITNTALSDVKTIILDQNVPNPFAEQTTISYLLTEDVQHAQMLFYNSTGKLINSVELNGRGRRQLNVFANDLSNGIYTYTLVVDGKIIDTKRMIKNE